MAQRLARRIVVAIALGLVFGASGCDCGDDTGATPYADAGPIVTREPVTVTDSTGTWTCYVTACAGHVTECGDCTDNDSDGFVDQTDRECLGPCDNTESAALLAGVGGETGGPCKADCYFDYGNGPGNDDCFHDHRCDPLSMAPTYDPEGPDCEYEASRVGTSDCPADQSATCYDVCRPLTPNGCDCFGCCTFPEIATRPAAEGGSYVWLGSVVEGTNDGTCTFTDILDTTKCRPCTPVGNCLNPCDTCEICIGRPDLPIECQVDGGPYMRCPSMVQPCGLEGDAPCPQDYYCVTGCCQSTLI